MSYTLKQFAHHYKTSIPSSSLPGIRNNWFLPFTMIGTASLMVGTGIYTTGQMVKSKLNPLDKSIKHLEESSTSLRMDMNKMEKEILEDIRKMHKDLKEDIREMRNDLKEEIREMREDLSDLKNLYENVKEIYGISKLEMKI